MVNHANSLSDSIEPQAVGPHRDGYTAASVVPRRMDLIYKPGLAIGLGLCFVLVVAAGGFGPVETVEATRFVLKQPDGPPRAVLGFDSDQSPELVLFDESGKVRLSLEVASNGTPSVRLHDTQHGPRATLAVRPDGTPGLCLTGERRDIRLSLDLGKDGSSGVNVYGENGSLRAAMAVRPDGTPAVGLFDAEGHVQRSFEVGAAPGVAPDHGRSPEPKRGD